MAFRKKMSKGKSKRVWSKGNQMHKVNKGIYSRRNRGGVRF